MKRSIGKYLLLFIFLLNSVSGWGQLRLYTRKYLIQDFMSKPTKVVLSGSREFRSSLRQEITALWTITPYEFCSQAEFNKQKDNSDCYFLHTEVNKGIVFLTLSRQGNKNDNALLGLLGKDSAAGQALLKSFQDLTAPQVLARMDAEYLIR